MKTEQDKINCSVVFHTKLDTSVNRILPVRQQKREWVYLFGENGIVLTVDFNDFKSPIVDAFECKY
jgi:hypothetical protein